MKIIKILSLFLLLAVYFTFSSGIVITIHHCCHHCYEMVQKSHTHDACHSSCCSEEGEQSHDAEPEKQQHHHSHDSQFFFKILDDYDKTNIVFPVSWKVFQTNIIITDTEVFLTSLHKTLIKDYIDRPSIFLLQGSSLLVFCQQRVYYA